MSTTDTPRTILVTGSYGALASSLVDHLRSRGHTVSTLLLEEYAVASPHLVQHQHTSMPAPNDLGTAVEAADVILMMTGIGPVATLVADAESLDIVLARAAPDTALIHTSSLAVLSGTGVLDEATDPQTPPYADTQRVLEQRIDTAQDWLRTVILRPGLVYGDDGGPLVQAAIDHARGAGLSRYVGNPEDQYPTVHERDLLALYQLLIEDDRADGVYHGAAGSITAGTLASLIAKHAGVDGTTAWRAEDLSEELGMDVDIPGLDLTLAPSRAIADLGWAPSGPTLQSELA